MNDLEHLDSSKIVNEYDQEIPQSQTADNPVAGMRVSGAARYNYFHPSTI